MTNCTNIATPNIVAFGMLTAVSITAGVVCLSVRWNATGSGLVVAPLMFVLFQCVSVGPWIFVQ